MCTAHICHATLCVFVLGNMMLPNQGTDQVLASWLVLPHLFLFHFFGFPKFWVSGRETRNQIGLAFWSGGSGLSTGSLVPRPHTQLTYRQSVVW